VLTTLYNSILKALETQHPDTFTLTINVTATWENDPGGGLTATLDDGKNNPALKGTVTVSDSRGK